MAKDTQGQKIQKNERIRDIVFKWIIEEPSITDYKISEKLKDEFNFKASQPSVASWRKNYYPQMFLDYEAKLDSLSNPISEKIDIKLASLSKINQYIEELERRRALLSMIMPDYSVKNLDPATTHVRYVTSSELETEERYHNNLKFIVDLIKERDKLIGGWSPYDVALETAQKVTEMVALYLKVSAGSEEYRAFKEALLQFDASLKERYDIKK